MHTADLDPDTLTAFANELADLARPIALSYFRTPLDVAAKSDDSPVTIADRTIETVLRAAIETRFPDHGIFGEEMGIKKSSSPYTWVVDPIDGTKSFITGFPLFGTLVALARDGRPFLGLIDAPATGERWTGVPGRASFAGRPATTSVCHSLADARLYTTSPDAFREESERAGWERVATKVKLRRFGGDCYIYGLLASGHVDLIVECGLQPYDYMALVPVIEGAGGVITDWEGAPLSLGSSGCVVAAATPELHVAALQQLKQC